MSKLKPVGSEKLKGDEKLKRILELARYKENIPQSINETNNLSYGIEMSDNMQYFIVREKSGYVIKRGINESVADYIEPMKNRRYYRGYSDALKKINLIAKELNELNGVKEGISLFGEQKKYTLKTPQPAPAPAPAPMPMDTVPDTPPPVPSPELPPAPTEEPMPEDMGMGVDTSGMELGGAELPMEKPEKPAAEEGPVTFRTLQKIVGKLTQKTRMYENEEGLTSEEIKYILNMVISALDLNKLEAEDREDVLSRFEASEEMVEPEMGAELEQPMDMEAPEGEEMPPQEPMEGFYMESKIDKIISSYFEPSKTEIRNLFESVEQKNTAKKFKNTDWKFIGKTNLKSLVFERNGNKIKITPSGKIQMLEEKKRKNGK